MFDPLEERVISVIQKLRKTLDQPITIDSTFEALGLDSLDSLGLVFDLEEEFSVAFPNDEAVKINSVRAAVESLKKFLPKSGINRGGAAGHPAAV